MACAGLGACDRRHDAETSAGPTNVDRATGLVAMANVLPSRAEVVALADALAIDSSRKGKGVEGAKEAHLAGNLRARVSSNMYG